MTVHDKDAPPVRRNMKSMFLNGHGTVSPEMIQEELVVIPGDINDSCAFARFTQNFLNHIAMLLRPVNSPAERPNIDQVADDVELLEIVLSQKIE